MDQILSKDSSASLPIEVWHVVMDHVSYLFYLGGKVLTNSQIDESARRSTVYSLIRVKKALYQGLLSRLYENARLDDHHVARITNHMVDTIDLFVRYCQHVHISTLSVWYYLYSAGGILRSILRRGETLKFVSYIIKCLSLWRC